MANDPRLFMAFYGAIIGWPFAIPLVHAAGCLPSAIRRVCAAGLRRRARPERIACPTLMID
jgi:hypothetical protein